MRITIFIIKFILKIIFIPLYIINFFIPKNKNIWIFGSWSGKKYNDNSRALYEYVCGKKNIKAIWLTKNKKIFKNLKKEKKLCYPFYSLQGIYYSIVAGVAIMSTSYVDLNLTTFLFSRKTKLIQLWHGTPLKQMDLKAGNVLEKIIRFIFLTYLGREYDLIVSATTKNIAIYEKVFNINRNKIKILGQPRNDIIFHKSNNFLCNNQNIDKIFLYMPTWRNYKCDLFIDHGFILNNFDDFLIKNRSILIVKVHPNDTKKYKYLVKSKNIIFQTNIDDIYPILQNIDVLLTDYSSIYVDFLLLNKPIIFTPFDFEKYNKENGFYYNYNKITPGPKARNWDGVINSMQDIINGIDSYRKRRMKINYIFNKYQDDNSAKRVYEEIIQINAK